LLSSVPLEVPVPPMPATARTAVLEFDLSRPVRDYTGLDGFSNAQILLRLHGEPLAVVKVPVMRGRVAAADFLRRVIDDHAGAVGAALVRAVLFDPHVPRRLNVADLMTPRVRTRVNQPLVTVAVCTRERPDDLARCLEALGRLDYHNLDLLVVDNAPCTDATERVVRRHLLVRYVREPRPGLDWARNRAILECRGEILAYTDDDVIVDPGWVSALVDVFAADPEVMAVTGLVIAHELDTEAQHLFETYGGFGRGFLRKWYRAAADRPLAPVHGGTGKFGTGANMAYRRSLFDCIGGFDPALDVGTCTNGGGDLEMFFRVLKEGHTLVYEPRAMVRHRHRREYEQLRTQIANNGIGFYSFLVRTALSYPDERRAIARLAAWWFRWWNLRRLLRSLAGLERIPRELIAGELVGSLRGLRRYQRARAEALRIAAAWPNEPTVVPAHDGNHTGLVASVSRHKIEAVRNIDLSEPLEPILDATGYERLRIFVSWRGTLVGVVPIEHHGAVVSRLWLKDAIVHHLSAELLAARSRVSLPVFWSRLVADLVDRLERTVEEQEAIHPPVPWSHALTVSVVVATYDRPDDLQACLKSLVLQQTTHPVEIIVVDNHPDSGITRRVVDAFPTVRLIEERRGGLSYARNAGILAAAGEIIATTDDDAVCAPDWIERLVLPFERDDVMIVTGNVLPAELETDAQRMFEAYGGLGRGFSRFIADADWFRRWRRSVPTWEIGCTANAAFRASVFCAPEIGLVDEALGAGTPTGCSEDTYVFYRVLKAGYTIAYEPDARVWHRHRDTMRALRKQIYNYSKGHVAYQLTTWWNDGDRRALVRLVYELPRTYMRRAYERGRGRSHYPMSFIALEVLGNLAGPWALWRSRRRVRRLGRSASAGVKGEGHGARAVSGARREEPGVRAVSG
jgi:glycosyltransferase involved in cell wall biosynthesis